MLAARPDDVLEELGTRIRAAGGLALMVPTDVADADQVEALADQATRRFGRIDV